MSCFICNSDSQRSLFGGSIEDSEWILNGVKYGYLQCENCGFIQCDPLPSEGTLKEFYKHSYSYDWFAKNSFYKKIQARHRIYKVSRWLTQGGKILDFGCGHGFFVKALLDNRFDCYGFDIGVEKIEQDSQERFFYGPDIYSDPRKGFDVITAWHVIEHMRDVNGTMRELHEKLGSGGVLIVAVPNMTSIGYKFFKQKWGWVQQPYVHVNQFTKDSLAVLFEKHGFEIEAVSTIDTWDQNIYDLLVTHFFYKNKSRNPVRKYSKGIGGSVFFKANQLVRLFFTLPSYLLSWLLKRRMQGSELMIVGRKK